jgi:CheY-like chemotaxis protein
MGSPNGKRILIVDDNPDLAQSLKDLLELEGYHVATATEPVAALDLARTMAPEVCILDIELPIMDGYELARRLRESPATEHAMLIALTGYGRDHDQGRSREAGFDHHLVKPVDVALLSRIVEGSTSSER